MAGLFLAGDAIFSSLAVGSILVVAVAVLGSLTVLPALLAKLGRWVDRPRVPLLWRLNRRTGAGGISRRILGPSYAAPPRSPARCAAGGARRAGARHEVHTATGETCRGRSRRCRRTRRRGGVPERRHDRDGSSRGAGRRDGARRPSPTRRAPTTAFAESPDELGLGGGRRTTSARPWRCRWPPRPAADDAVPAARRRWRRPPSDAEGLECAVGGYVAAHVDYAAHLSEAAAPGVGFVLLLTLMVMASPFRIVPSR